MATDEQVEHALANEFDGLDAFTFVHKILDQAEQITAKDNALRHALNCSCRSGSLCKSCASEMQQALKGTD